MKLIENEIEWCKKNPGKSEKGELFELGFIAGLEQALLLINNKAKIELQGKCNCGYC